MLVLQGFPYGRATTNPYLVMLVESLSNQPGVEVVNFSWKTAFIGRFDVYHTHWPENLGKGRTPLRSLVKQLLTLAFLLRLRLMRVPIVRTVHNLELPEGLSWLQYRILDLFNSQTSIRIRLNPHTPCPSETAVELIPHGHYIDWFSSFPTFDGISGRIAFVGLVRRYKGVEALISAFKNLEGSELSLSVSGNPSSAPLEMEIRALADGDPRIELNLAFQSEQQFAQRISESQLVVLPYHLMHNSGGTFAALSLNRPVLIPDNQINRELSTEVGDGWIHFYSGRLTAGDIRSTLESLVSNPATSPPNLSTRSWEAAGKRHVQVYRRSLQVRPGMLGKA